jgi:hypothetical protein
MRLDLAQDPGFSRRSWKFERAGWAGLALLLLAAVLGLLGPGAFSTVTRADDAVGLSVRFDRFVHFETETTLVFRVPRSGSGDTVEVWIDDAYQDAVEVEQIHPEPLRAAHDRGRTVYRFASGEEGGEVSFKVRPRRAGGISGRAGTSSGGGAEISQFVYP